MSLLCAATVATMIHYQRSRQRKRVYVLFHTVLLSNCINYRFCDGLFYGHIGIFVCIYICPSFFKSLTSTKQAKHVGLVLSDLINE